MTTPEFLYDDFLAFFLGLMHGHSTYKIQVHCLNTTQQTGGENIIKPIHIKYVLHHSTALQYNHTI